MHGGVGGAQHAARLLEQCSARRGQRDAAVRAVEEPDAELVLELADLLADGRLGDVEPLPGAAEVQLFGDGDEVPEMAEFHRWAPFTPSAPSAPSAGRGAGRSRARGRARGSAPCARNLAGAR